MTLSTMWDYGKCEEKLDPPLQLCSTEKGLLKIFFLTPDLIKGGTWHSPLPLCETPSSPKKRWKMLAHTATCLISHLLLSRVNSANMLSLCTQEAILPLLLETEELCRQHPQVSAFIQDMFIVTPLPAQIRSLYKWEQSEYFACV